MEVLIPSVMALRGTAMTAPLDQQGEPFAPFGTTLDWQGGFGRFLANVAELCYYYKEKGTIRGKPIKQ